MQLLAPSVLNKPHTDFEYFSDSIFECVVFSLAPKKCISDLAELALDDSLDIHILDAPDDQFENSFKVIPSCSQKIQVNALGYYSSFKHPSSPGQSPPTV